MIQTKEQHLNIWLNVNHIGGWLRLLEQSPDFTQEDFRALELIDENAIAYEKEAENIYFESGSFEIRKQLNEFSEEFDEDLKKVIRLRYLNKFIEILESKIKVIWEEYLESARKNEPEFLREAMLEIKGIDEITKKLKSFSVEKYLLDHPESLSKVDRVSPEEIARALSFPFNQLVQFNKVRFATCPFHEETTASFYWYPKTNTAHCWGCGWTGNVIKFLMDKDKGDFKTVVRSLLNL